MKSLNKIAPFRSLAVALLFAASVISSVPCAAADAPRTIQVVGVGRASVSPDMITVSMTLSETRESYAEAMTAAAESFERLRGSIRRLGFSEGDLKTYDFSVYSEYRDTHTKVERERIFVGYKVSNAMRLGFAFNTETLARVLSAAAESETSPEISIAFAVKDQAAASAAALQRAAADAQRKASILAEACGAKLGMLLSVESGASFGLAERNVRFSVDAAEMNAAPAAPKISPDDIDLSETATFTWSIED